MNNRTQVDSIDLLHDAREESMSIDASASQSRTFASAFRKTRSVKRSFNNRASSEIIPGVHHEKLKNQDDVAFPGAPPKQHVPFRIVVDNRNQRECLICFAMVIALMLVLAGMFGLVLLIALHPRSPSISVDKVSGGILYLYTDANNTILTAAMNLTLLSATPNANAAMEYQSSSLLFSFQNHPVGRFVTPSFRQSSHNESMPFLAFINSSTSFTGKADLESSIRSGFEKQNVTFEVKGTVRVRRKVARVVASNAVVSVNCNVSFTPSSPPVILAKACEGMPDQF